MGSARLVPQSGGDVNACSALLVTTPCLTAIHTLNPLHVLRRNHAKAIWLEPRV
jgi:hypothetical protein